MENNIQLFPMANSYLLKFEIAKKNLSLQSRAEQKKHSTIRQRHLLSNVRRSSSLKSV
jgi:hypothetical protein